MIHALLIPTLLITIVVTVGYSVWLEWTEGQHDNGLNVRRGMMLLDAAFVGTVVGFWLGVIIYLLERVLTSLLGW